MNHRWMKRRIERSRARCDRAVSKKDEGTTSITTCREVKPDGEPQRRNASVSGPGYFRLSD